MFAMLLLTWIRNCSRGHYFADAGIFEIPRNSYCCFHPSCLRVSFLLMQCAHLKLIERQVKHCWRAYLCNVTGLAKMGELCIDERIENAVYATVLAIMQIYLSFYDRTQTLCVMMILKVFVSRKSRLMKYCMINFVVFKKQRGAVHIRILVRISICSCIGHPCM